MTDLIKYKNGKVATMATSLQRNRIDLKREQQFIRYPALLKWINQEFDIKVTDIGQLTKLQADLVIRALDAKRVTK